jgi:hypothetical protein
MTTAAASPTMDTLLDVDQVGPIFAPMLSGGAPAVVASRRLIWRPGSRALIAYRVVDPYSGSHRYLLGKHYARAARASRVNATWQALERVPFLAGTGVPPLVGWCPALSMVVYQPADGRPLDQLAIGGALNAGLRGAGEWLATLHRSAVSFERCFDVDEEVDAAATWADRLAAVHRAHGALAARLAVGLREAVSSIRFKHDAPIHKDFHYRHVLLGSRLTALDFDEMRMGDPRFDVAHFCTYLRLLEIRLGRSGTPPLEQPFLDAYSPESPIARDAAFLFFSLYTCLKIAKQLGAGSGVEPRPTGHATDRQLALVLAYGRDLSRALLGRLDGS